MPNLFDPIQIGDLTLPNRIVMAPLTRSRATDSRIPNALMAVYYAQRAGAGLIISEATSVTPMGIGYSATPGIWSTEQVEGYLSDIIPRLENDFLMALPPPSKRRF